MAIILLMIYSIIGDVDTILNGHRADPPIQTYRIQYILIAMKIITGFVAYRTSPSSAFLMVSVILVDALFNRNFTIDTKFEDIILICGIFVIFVYEWLQVNKNKSSV